MPTARASTRPSPWPPRASSPTTPTPTATRSPRRSSPRSPTARLALASGGGFTYTPTAGYTGPDSFTYRANDGTVNSNTATVSLTVSAASSNLGLQLNGSTQYVTFGAAPGLNASTYTLELWFNRTGAGAGTSTGTGGIASAIPLLTKGRAEAETPANLNMDWFLGIDATTGQLVADFEDNATGANHPVTGTAVVSSNVWHHVAATYGAGTWNLYLDGVLDKTLAVGAFTPEATSIQHAALGTAMTSTGVAGGFFAGVVDEARVWNVVRTAAQISANKNLELTSGSGLIGRWGLNEASGTRAANSVSGGVAGTLVGAPPRVAGFVPPSGGGNQAPVAVADSYSTPLNTTLTVAAPGVLANDTDADGNPLTAAVVTRSAHGSLALASGGGFTYTPTAGYSGPDSFTYQANDGTVNSNTATVSLTVTATNTAPVAANDTYTTPKNTTLTVAAPGVLANDTDADGNSLTAAVVTSVSHGTLTLGANGSISYVPTAAYSGPDSFTYRANDGALDSNTATVSLTVTATNSAPVAVADSYSTPKNTTLVVAAPGVLANDTDADGNPLTAAVVANVAHGTLTLGANGSISYVPTAGYSGPDSFTYRANDGTVNSNTATVSLTVSAPVQGYWMVASDGGIFAFGGAGFFGSKGGQPLDKPIVGMSPTPSGNGYWLVASDGGIFSFGDALFYGSKGGQPLDKPIVGMASSPSGHGYWLVASDGGIFNYGDALFYGSKGGQPLTSPIVGMSATPSGQGYWMVAADGGIFSFGNAGFHGSTGGQVLDQPIVAMAATPSGNGYWLVASDGGIFTFGDASFFGSTGGQPLDQPIVGMTPSASGNGYWLVASDGGIFSFGDALFHGSMGGTTLDKPVVGMAGR